MALIKCPECEKEISDKALFCPNCGYPMSEKITERFKGEGRDQIEKDIVKPEIETPKSPIENNLEKPRQINIKLKNGDSIKLEGETLSIKNQSGTIDCEGPLQSYSLTWHKVVAPIVGPICWEMVIKHEDTDTCYYLKSAKTENSYENVKELFQILKKSANINMAKSKRAALKQTQDNQAADIVVHYRTGFWSSGRLTIGIISIILFVVISFQSCAAGLSNTLQDNGATSGSMGFFLAILFMVAGIVGICTRNSKSKIGAIISTVLYWIGALGTIGTGSTYGDLPIWGGLSFAFGIVFLISALKTKN